MVSLAQIIQSRFAVGGMGEAVLGALAVAGKKELTFLALAGQGILFHLSELELAVAVHHLDQCLLVYVAQFVFRKDEVVAGIHITVELHDTGMSAGLGQGADSWLYTYPVGQGRVKQLDEEFAHVFTYPFIEQSAEEVSPLLRRYGKVSQFLPFLQWAGQVASVGMGTDTFHNRSKLNVAAVNLLEEMIEIQRIVGIEVVDYGQGIPFHSMFFSS